MGGAPVIVGKRGDRNRVREIAKVLFDNGSDDPEVHANARLIAAAPDLLEALRLVRVSNGWRYLAPESRAVILAAIRKAEGA